MSPSKPRPLAPGSTIAFVSPSSPLAREKAKFTFDLLEGFGYRLVSAPNAWAGGDYLCGTDQQRADDLHWAFDHPEVDAVACTRGGYGAARLLPYLDLDRLAASRKLFFGYSDVTTLHLALNRRGLPTLYSPMAITLSVPREPWVYESLRRCLAGDPTVPEAAPRGRTVVGGTAEGVTTGGCLCLLTDSLATADPLDADGRILVIEDVDEMPHRVDAMLTHLLNSGVAQRAAGFVIGEMTRTDELVDPGIGGRPWREIVTDRLAPLGKPLILDYPFGHMKQMLSIPMGISAVLDADAGTLRFTESPCEA